MRGTHGVVGGNLFLVAYVAAMWGPAMRLFSAPQQEEARWIAIVVMLVTTVVTMRSIWVHGGGGAGEPFGCLAAILVWLGRFAGPALACRLAPASAQPDLWGIIGGSIPPLAMAAALWFVTMAGRE